MSVYEAPVKALHGDPASLGDYRGEAMLIVNVASRCGNTPRYAQPEELQHRNADRGFTVLGFPCNQFGKQEPGTADQIAAFCSLTYRVTFPMVEKIDVNGPHRHPLYAGLTAVADIEWTFEKFIVSPGGEIVARFRPDTLPDAPEVVAAIEALLPA